jgi:UDP-2,4-diacetamido-2,4,6-trideoxy-beta-L-altropyranose hydrolase
MAFNRTDQDFLLRLASDSDCRTVWEWANDPVTRSASFSSDFIPWENHVKWFKAKLLDINCLFYIVEDISSSLIGQVRYEIEEKQAVVSIGLASESRGKGYASPILCKSSQKLFENTAVEIIHAYIKPNNTPSLRAFAKANFINNGLVHMNNHQAFEFILHR